jgi:hypothetical protein
MTIRCWPRESVFGLALALHPLLLFSSSVDRAIQYEWQQTHRYHSRDCWSHGGLGGVCVGGQSVARNDFQVDPLMEGFDQSATATRWESMTGAIRNELGNLHCLQTLFFDGNEFTDSLPTELAH